MFRFLSCVGVRTCGRFATRLRGHSVVRALELGVSSGTWLAPKLVDSETWARDDRVRLANTAHIDTEDPGYAAPTAPDAEHRTVH
jgi:hypothetical protein